MGIALFATVCVVLLTLTAFANEEIAFQAQPESVAAYYDNYKYGQATVTWAVNAPDGITYEIYQFDGATQSYGEPIESNVTECEYMFHYDGEESTVKYQIRAVKDEQTVATSAEFTVTWTAHQYIDEIIRIDGSALIGAKVPKNLAEYYPQSEAYSYNMENPNLNVWYPHRDDTTDGDAERLCFGHRGRIPPPLQ